MQNCSLAESLDLASVVEVLTKHLLYLSVQTKVAVLKWIHHLFINIPHKMFNHIEDLFPILMKSLSDTSDEVVQQTLVVMAEIISSKSPEAVTTDPNAKVQNKYFTKFIVNLLRLFSTDRHLLEERGAFIIRELCVLLSAEDIYKTLAKILLEEQNLSFACTMIQTLNVILLTSSELFDLRNKLRRLDSPVSFPLLLLFHFLARHIQLLYINFRFYYKIIFIKYDFLEYTISIFLGKLRVIRMSIRVLVS